MLIQSVICLVILWKVYVAIIYEFGILKKYMMFFIFLCFDALHSMQILFNLDIPFLLQNCWKPLSTSNGFGVQLLETIKYI